MSSAVVDRLARSRPVETSSTARIVVVVALALTALLAAALLIASLLPTATLAQRLLATAGEARSGSNTQELLAHLGERLRFAAISLLALDAGLVVLRAPFEQTVRTVLNDLGGPKHWPRPADVVAICIGVGLAAGLRVVFLSQPMRYDEALTFNEFASRPLYYGLSFYPDPNNHLLNTLLIHLAYVGLGNQPWVLRLPALVGGLALVAATYALGRQLYGPRSAVLGAVLVAVSSYLVEYSTNARGYTLQALCFVGLLCLVILAARRDSPTALFLAALVAAVGAYALSTMLYGIVVASAWFWLEARRARPKDLRWGHAAVGGLVAGLTILLLYLPVVLISGPDNIGANRFVVALDGPELVRELPRSLAQTWALWNRDVPLPIAAVLLMGFVAATVNEVRRARIPLGLLAPLLCVAMVLIQRVAPFERVWLFLLPLYLTTASGGLARLVDGRLLALAGGAILGLVTLTSGSILASPDTGTFPDAEAVARTLSGRLAPDDAVLTTVPTSLPELQYYFPRAGLTIATLVRQPDEARHLFVVTALDATPSVSGWSATEDIARFSQSRLVVMERSPPPIATFR